MIIKMWQSIIRQKHSIRVLLVKIKIKHSIIGLRLGKRVIMESKNRNNTSKNLDNAIIKLYYEKLILSSIIISKDKYYLIFSDQSMLEIVHNQMNDDDIYKIILLIEEAKEIVHHIFTSSEDFQKLLNK